MIATLRIGVAKKVDKEPFGGLMGGVREGIDEVAWRHDAGECQYSLSAVDVF